MNLKKNKKSLILIGLFFSLFLTNIFISGLNFQTSNLNEKFTQKEENHDNFKNDFPHTQATYDIIYEDQQWLDNPSFTTTVDPWTNITTGTDTDDLNASYSNDAINYEVLGEEYTYSNVNGTPTPSKGWISNTNYQYPTKQTNTDLNDQGLFAQQLWAEGADQQTAVEYKKDILMARNMSLYEITSASLSMVVNETVESYYGAEGASAGSDHGVEVAGDDTSNNADYTTGDQFNVGDFAKFYISLSDQNGLRNYTDVLTYSNRTIGEDSTGAGVLDVLPDTLVEIEDEADLVFTLNNLFQNYNNYNVSIIIGIFVNCEDNFYTDQDDFEELYIKEVNLTFTYSRKIEQGTSLSFEQTANKVTGENIQISEALLNFKYKVDPSWTESLNSEFQIYINNTKYPETRKLTDVPTNYDYAKSGGFDITDQIRTVVGNNGNISISIALYIADDFALGNKVTFSIDDVTLNITYTETKDEETTSLDILIDQDDKTLNPYKQIPRGEKVNISVVYKDSSLAFIDGASVTISGPGVSDNMDESPLNHYNYSIDTSLLNFGENYYTVTANNFTYEVQTKVITIDVIKRSSYIDNIILNTTEADTITVPWNTTFGISVSYNDTISNDFIQSATVQFTGTAYSTTLSESGETYFGTIDTESFQIGPNYLSISASGQNHSLASETITIIVTERETTLDIYLDENLGTSIEFTYGEDLNITAIYEDEKSSKFLENSVIQLKDGTAVLYTFDLHPSVNQYNLTINTAELEVGVSALSVYAKKDNYTESISTITISVSQRTTDLDVYLNTAPVLGIDIAHGEILNITAMYKDIDASNSFISGATVELREGTTILYTFNPHPSFDQYNLTINTADLGLGVNSLAVYATKENFTISSETITITVQERDTALSISLGGTEQTSISIDYNEDLNITAIYKDVNLANAFITEATVELRSGGSVIDTLDKHPSLNQYNLTINTASLSLGVNSLSVYANKENYTAIITSIIITVEERDTSLSIYLGGAEQTSISIDYDEDLNITAIYSDVNLANTFITGATVELRSGGSAIGTLDPHPSLNQYNLTISTASLSLGVNSLSIYANKENYTAIITSITITVEERDTTLTIFLNETEQSSIGYPYDDSLNITVIYDDQNNGNFISSATVQLKSGETILDNFDEHASLDQYNLSINTNTLSVGVNALTIYAKQTNYSVFLASITITVEKIPTTLLVSINGTLTSTFSTYNSSIGEYLNITAVYNDYLGAFLNPATVNLNFDGTITPLTKDSVLDQYSITVEVATLGVGVNFLSISATRIDYQAQSEDITVNVEQRKTSLTIKINKTQILDEEKRQVLVNQYLNITANFTDTLSGDPITSATISLVNFGEFNESGTYDFYNYTIGTNELGQGVTILTVIAQRTGYQSQTLQFLIEIVEKDTELTVFLNQVDKTSDPTTEVVVGDPVNITVIYKDVDNLFLENATVQLTGEGIDTTLNQSAIYDQYNLTLDSGTLSRGVYILTLFAFKTNYEQQTVQIRIEILDKATDMHILLNSVNVTEELFYTMPYSQDLNITVKYFDNVTKASISGATILIRFGNEILGTLQADGDYYTLILEDTEEDLDIGLRILTLEASGTNYRTLAPNLRINVRRIQGEVYPEGGESTINAEPGDDVVISIQLNNIDFGGQISGAEVSFTSNIVQEGLKEGQFAEVSDGTYEFTLENVPEGTYTITITVQAGDNYEFERYEITINVVRPQEDVLMFQVITGVSIAAAIGLGAYLIAYQRVLKYPKSVRKVHKFKKALKKKKEPKLDIEARDAAFKGTYMSQIGSKTAKALKAKTGEQPKGPAEKSLDSAVKQESKKIEKKSLESVEKETKEKK